MPARGSDLRKLGNRDRKQTTQSRPATSCSQSSRAPFLLAVPGSNWYNTQKSPLTPSMNGVAFFAGQGSKLAQRRLQRDQTSGELTFRSMLHSSKSRHTRPGSLLESWTRRSSSSSALLAAQLEESRTKRSLNRISTPEVYMKNSSAAATVTSSTTRSSGHTDSNIVQKAMNASAFQKLKHKLKSTLTPSINAGPSQRRRTSVADAAGHHQWIKVSPIQRVYPEFAVLGRRKKSDEFEMLLQTSDATLKLSIVPLTLTASRAQFHPEPLLIQI